MRRLPAGGAPIALLLIGCISAGCGSGGTTSVGAVKPAVTKTSSTTAERSATTAPAHRHRGSRLTKAERTMVALAALAAQRHRGTLTKTNAVGAAPASSARATSALARVNKTCKVTLAGRTVPVACKLQRPLLNAARRNKALARLLGAAARRR